MFHVGLKTHAQLWTYLEITAASGGSFAKLTGSSGDERCVLSLLEARGWSCQHGAWETLLVITYHHPGLAGDLQTWSYDDDSCYYDESPNMPVNKVRVILRACFQTNV